ncbi:MgtC/SapB family protein [Candidatus Woesearchaeota archaeon]|nr:MgtC/SapB family protein [Candidatus Woesearchaeota archaeon]
MISETEMIVRLVAATIAGSIVGFERGRLKKPAGMRTHMMVCTGAALFTLAALSSFEPETARVAAGIITGIGFLGAGTIFKEHVAIRGLTTAASLWTIAAVGLSIALGLYLMSVVAVILVLIILELSRIPYFKAL